MFNFVVKYLGALKAIPALAFIFEGFLILYTLLTKPQLLDYVADIEAAALKWQSVTTKMHKYGGLQFNAGRREIGHIHGNGLMDIRLTRKIKEQLLQNGKIKQHHVFKNSGWISFYIVNAADVPYAVSLLEL
jgi:hypothetical protein